MRKKVRLQTNNVIKAPVGDVLTGMELIEQYVQAFPKATMRTYRSVLREWCEYFDGDVAGVTRTQAIRYFLEQREKEGQEGRTAGVSKKLTSGTLHHKRSILKTFYKFLEAEGLASAKIFEFPIQSPSAPTKRPTECLPAEIVRELLLLHRGHTRESIRDRAIVYHLFHTGCRREEIRQFCVGHFRLRADGLGEVTSITTKGGDPLIRVVPEECAHCMAILASQRLAEGISAAGPMYPSYRGKNGVTERIGSKWLYRHFKRWCEEVGVDPRRVSPHTARVSLATKMLEDTGGDYEKVSKVTGHKSVEMLRTYDHRFKQLKDNPGADVSWGAEKVNKV